MFLSLIVIKKGDGMMNKIKKLIGFLLFLIIILTSFNCQIFFAANNSPDVIGMVKSSIPYIQVELKENDLSNDDITAKLGSDSVTLYNLTTVKEQRSLTCIAFDNSKSMTQDNICPKGSFQQIKDDTISLIKNNVDANNQFCVYSIGEGEPKDLGFASDPEEVQSLTESLNSLKGNEDATNLNESLDLLYNKIESKQRDYGIVRILLVTDTSADYGMGIDISEINEKYGYNKIPLYTVCNTTSENSSTYKTLRTLSRNSGGEAIAYNFKENYSSVFGDVYKRMNGGYIASFICNMAADSKSRELNVSINGKLYSETVLLDTAIDIDADVTASVSYDKNSNSFNIAFHQEGFEGNIPVSTTALQGNSYIIKKSGGKKSLPIQRVELNSDGSYCVVMKKDIYTDKYDFEFRDITDLSSKGNTVEALGDVSIKAKSKFWLVFPYLVVAAVILIVLLAFYLILLNLKKKKNVKTIKEIFETQVNETVEEHRHIVNVSASVNQKMVSFYIRLSNNQAIRDRRMLQSSIIFGRNSACDFVINDAKMSNQHFALELVQGQVMIRDLESKNGTYVDGVRVIARQKIKSGSTVLAGSTVIKIEF